MRILFLSNFYPPARPGGYTQWCHEVAERLQARGHTVGVLTSDHELEKVPAGEEQIYRLLHLEGDLVYYRPLQFFTTWKRNHRENLATFKRVVKRFSPDILFVWGMWSMTKALPALAEELLPARVVYFLSDYWPAAVDMHTNFWQVPARRWYMRLPRRALSSIAVSILDSENISPTLEFRHAICVSAAVRDILVTKGLPLHYARIIHGGTNIERFSIVQNRHFGSGELKLLYAGQVVRHKGVHTAIEAMAILVNERKLSCVRLHIAGSGHPQYEKSLRRLVEDERLHDHVHFLGTVAKDEMPTLLQRYDVLVFPSVYEEPLARMTQEAMAAGMVVVGTTTGGTKEILVDGESGLIFEAENAEELATQIQRLALDPDLCCRLAAAGRRSVLEYFNLDRMVYEIEKYLHEVATAANHAAAMYGD